jgi:hypothetical protein
MLAFTSSSALSVSVLAAVWRQEPRRILHLWLVAWRLPFVRHSIALLHSSRMHSRRTPSFIGNHQVPTDLLIIILSDLDQACLSAITVISAFAFVDLQTPRFLYQHERADFYHSAIIFGITVCFLSSLDWWKHLFLLICIRLLPDD